jgi:hypothetical protein
MEDKSPATQHGGAWGQRMYSSYSFTTSALDGVSGQRHTRYMEDTCEYIE